MLTSGRGCRSVSCSNRAMLLLGVVILLLSGARGAAAADDNAVKLRLTAAEIAAEYPAASKRLIGAYSEIPGYPEGGKSVKLYVFRGSDLVCLTPIAGDRKEKISCWHWDDTPEPVRKLVNEKDAATAEQ